MKNFFDVVLLVFTVLFGALLIHTILVPLDCKVIFFDDYNEKQQLIDELNKTSGLDIGIYDLQNDERYKELNDILDQKVSVKFAQAAILNNRNKRDNFLASLKKTLISWTGSSCKYSGYTYADYDEFNNAKWFIKFALPIPYILVIATICFLIRQIRRKISQYFS